MRGSFTRGHTPPVKRRAASRQSLAAFARPSGEAHPGETPGAMPVAVLSSSLGGSMKHSGIATLIGRKVRLRPVPRRVFRGNVLATIDDHWVLRRGPQPGSLTMSLLGGSHTVLLSAAEVRGHDDTDVLTLRIQITLTELGSQRDPIPWNSARYDVLPDYRSYADWLAAGAT